jgi:hypothetical protein
LGTATKWWLTGSPVVPVAVARLDGRELIQEGVRDLRPLRDCRGLRGHHDGGWAVSGFELALAPSFRADFRDSFYRLVGALTGTGVTVLMTLELPPGEAALRFSPYLISFLADDIVVLRYDKRPDGLDTSMLAVKMRRSGLWWLLPLSGLIS